MSVYKKLSIARNQFHELKLTKTGLNKFAGYSYFTLGDFLIPALRVFAENGLCGVISFDKDTATMRIVDVEGGGEIVLTSPMGSAMLKGCHEVQNIGAVETYQRRYLWVAALEIVEHDALDATTGKGAKKDGVADSFRSSPTMGAMEELPEEQRQYIRDLAMELIGIFRTDPAQLVPRLTAENLDGDQKTALWSQLDSKTRAFIKANKG